MMVDRDLLWAQNRLMMARMRNASDEIIRLWEQEILCLKVGAAQQRDAMKEVKDASEEKRQRL